MTPPMSPADADAVGQRAAVEAPHGVAGGHHPRLTGQPQVGQVGGLALLDGGPRGLAGGEVLALARWVLRAASSSGSWLRAMLRASGWVAFDADEPDVVAVGIGRAELAPHLRRVVPVHRVGDVGALLEALDRDVHAGGLELAAGAAGPT